MCNRNRIANWRFLTAVGVVLAGSAVQAQILSIDMDPLTAGIQNTLSATDGQNIAVDIVLQPGPAGVSSYGVSVQYDNTELAHTADTEPLPIGFQFNITPGSGGLVPNVAPGLDQVNTFEAATFGMGPVAGSLVIGNISFTVATPANDGLPDIVPGFFVGGVNGMFDNAGAGVAPVINSGFLIPEPGVIYGAALVLGFAAFQGYRKRRLA